MIAWYESVLARIMEHDPSLFVGPEDPLQNHPRYSTLRVLSEGSCGTVLLAYDTADREYVAVKLVERLVRFLDLRNESIRGHSDLAGREYFPAVQSS